jgi:hypothetical protein
VDLRELQRALRRKLKAIEDSRSDHVFYFVTINGEEHRAAKFSHSSKGGRLPDFVVADTAKRLKLDKAELEDLVECPLTADVFLELWQARSD